MVDKVNTKYENDDESLRAFILFFSLCLQSVPYASREVVSHVNACACCEHVSQTGHDTWNRDRRDLKCCGRSGGLNDDKLSQLR